MKSEEKLVLERYQKFVPYDQYALIDDVKTRMYFATNGRIVFKVDEEWDKPNFNRYVCYLENGDPVIERRSSYYSQ